MKKTFCLLIASFCLPVLMVHAQDDDLTKKQDGQRPEIIANDHNRGFTMGMGFRAGGTMTSLSGEPNEGDFSDGANFGYTGGLTFNMRFGKSNPGQKYSGRGIFGIEIGALYKQLVAKTKGDDDLKLTCVDVPLMLQLYPGFKAKGLTTIYLEAGPVFSIPIGAKPDEITVNGNRSYKTGDLKPFDVRVAAGLGWRDPNSGVGLSFRYYLGMSELAKNFPVKVNVMELALTYKFNIAGNNKYIKNN